MKLLFDENLSPRLVSSFFDLYPESRHVHTCNLGGEDDDAGWEYARSHGYMIVSKDSDFAERSVLDSDPPKLVWVRLGNCSTLEVEALLRSAHENRSSLTAQTFPAANINQSLT